MPSAARAVRLPPVAAVRDFRTPRADLDGKVVLVTGGTGSFGRAFTAMACREYRPKKLIVFSRDELKQYEMAQAFPPERYPFLRLLHRATCATPAGWRPPCAGSTAWSMPRR